MKDPDGVQFLQWCLPRLRLRWPGFRKVRRRVYKCIDRRLRQLGLADVSEYRRYLERDAGEWRALDACCRIPISRFFRDRAVFASLEEEVLPRLAEIASARHEQRLQCWSIGCASGEEPYTLSILWRIRIAPRFPGLGLRVLATDVDTHALERARRGCYGRGSLKDLPADLLARAFTPSPQGLCLKPEYREGVELFQQDVRLTMPPGPFHLVFCRNLAFTYFEAALQREILGWITERLCPGGALVIGSLESLPAEVAGLEPWSGRRAVYRRSAPDPGQGGARSPAPPRSAPLTNRLELRNPGPHPLEETLVRRGRQDVVELGPIAANDAERPLGRSIVDRHTRAMAERRVGSLPVVDNGKLVGKLTERDVLRVLSRERGALRVSPEGSLW